MAWLAVDKDRTEAIYDEEPYRYNEFWEVPSMSYWIVLPEGTIEKILGRKLTWDDDSVEIK